MSSIELIQQIEARLSRHSQLAAEDIRALIAALRQAEDDRRRYEFEADEAAKALVSARADALQEAADLCEERAGPRKQRHTASSVSYNFAGRLARDIRALAEKISTP